LSFAVANAVTVGTYRLILRIAPSHIRHLARIERRIAA